MSLRSGALLVSMMRSRGTRGLNCAGDLNPETGEISPDLDLNSKTGEKSPDRGDHAGNVTPYGCAVARFPNALTLCLRGTVTHSGSPSVASPSARRAPEPPFGAALTPSGDCQLDMQNGLIWRAASSPVWRERPFMHVSACFRAGNSNWRLAALAPHAVPSGARCKQAASSSSITGRLAASWSGDQQACQVRDASAY